MCGIVGYFSFAGQSRADLAERLRDAVSALQHRGPDGQYLWTKDGRDVGLAHARLSIIDLSTVANQPMHDPVTGNVLVFNGEIYNHAVLRRELSEQTGAPWTTDHSDTEVILRAYQIWGKDCLHRFIGMFSFALWDAQQESLWLVRDRLGIKPLYFARGQQCMLFASELTSLMRFREVAAKCNHQAVLDYLSLLSIPAPDSLVEGVGKLSPGSWLWVDSQGGERSQVYWDMLGAASPLRDAVEAGHQVRSLLKDSVRLRLEADVPVGVFLSGGIDSTLNLGLFSEICPGSVNSYCIGYDQHYQSSHNEFAFARLAAERFGANHHELVVSEADCLQAVSSVCAHFDEPLGDPSCLPTWLVSKFARQEGMTVCQVGEGSDEIFFGYSSWRWKYWLCRLSRWLPGVSTRVAQGLIPGASLLTELNYPQRQATVGQPFWGSVDVVNPELKRNLCALDAGLRYSQWPHIEKHWQVFQATCAEPTTTKWFSYLDLKLRVPELLLMRVDRMSMAHGLECRVPFLDHRLVEFALSLPESIRCPRLKLKTLLKTEFTDLLPEQLIRRPKQGFWFPLDDWLDSQLGLEIRDTVNSFQRSTGILSAPGLSRLWESRKNSRRLVRKRLGLTIWSLFVLAKSWENVVAAYSGR